MVETVGHKQSKLGEHFFGAAGAAAMRDRAGEWVAADPVRYVAPATDALDGEPGHHGAKEREREGPGRAMTQVILRTEF
jgi:hypothetical protein